MLTSVQSEFLLKEYFPVWDSLTREEQLNIINNSALKEYGKGELLHQGDMDCVGLFIINTGKIRTYLLSDDGKEVTLYRLGHGDTCILSASCALATITFDVYIEAEEKTQVLLISSSFFSSLMEKNIYVECFSYKLATERFSDVMWAMQQILFMNLDQRLAIFLWDELSRSEGNVIHITHEQIARYIGSAREVVSRMLKYFVADGIVELSRGGIRIVDKKRLRKLI
ncbi:Crp/Fnr family transcriptional regulator [Ruminococcus sp. OA3]|uniref:Crp/Fnr family transcriptional regulator n=1 Tax=Ruminococcus sp. OA3 TaxID=2914164 RepID=UPI001F06E9AE|nr:Crp/Fnr family transcriptional regulator [Ruminococcus sp. OA3]MCH1981599.1 Crp/Fnr family transcriptional regulator [Ruminococcus sp. OA3]